MSPVLFGDRDPPTRLEKVRALKATTGRSWDAPLGRLIVTDVQETPEGNLWVSISSPDFECDPDGYYFVNPPIMVPDGTFRTVTDPESGQPRQVENARENHLAAFRAIVTDAAMYYATHPEVWGNTTTTVYSDSADGRVRSQHATYTTARSGGSLNVATTALVGEVAGQAYTTVNRIWELFYSFDTSSIPDADTISSAVFSIYGGSPLGEHVCTFEARLKDWGATLETTDWVAGADLAALTLLATFDSTAWDIAAYNDFTSDGAFVSNVSKTGVTYIMVSSSKHRLGTAPATDGSEDAVHEGYLADETGTTKDPKLVVIHSAGGTELVIQDASHAHSAESQSLTQVHELAVQEASHGHAADQQALTQVHQLAVQEAAHSHTADSPSLTQVHNLVTADGLHGHAADNVVLALEGELDVAGATHAHSADNVALSQVYELVIQEASHGHFADALVLILNLAIQDAFHGHSADAVALTQVHLLVIADALHGHEAEVVTIGGGPTGAFDITIGDLLLALEANEVTSGVAVGAPQT